MLKQIALRIAALADADQQWLLAMLSASERRSLEPLIAEAMSLGLHLDPSVLNSLANTGKMNNTLPAQPERAPDVVVEALNKVDPFWRQLLTDGIDNSVTTNASDFQRMLMTATAGPTALRQCLLDYLDTTGEASHV